MILKPQSITKELLSFDLRKKSKNTYNVFAGGFSSQSSELTSFIESNESFNILQSHCKYLSNTRKGAITLRNTAYSPASIINNTYYPVDIPTIEKKSDDIYFQWYDKKLFVKTSANYQLSVNWYVTGLDSSNSTVKAELWLYKNGLALDMLDSKDMYINVGVLASDFYYFPTVSLQGTKHNLFLTPSDYLEIRIYYAINVGGTDWVSPDVVHSGYLDVIYDTINGKT